MIAKNYRSIQKQSVYNLKNVSAWPHRTRVQAHPLSIGNLAPKCLCHGLRWVVEDFAQFPMVFFPFWRWRWATKAWNAYFAKTLNEFGGFFLKLMEHDCLFLLTLCLFVWAIFWSVCTFRTWSFFFILFAKQGDMANSNHALVIPNLTYVGGESIWLKTIRSSLAANDEPGARKLYFVLLPFPGA